MGDLLNYLTDFSDFFLFWKTVGFERFVRFFWFFFFFELPRYVVIDFLVLTVEAVYHRLQRPRWLKARVRLRAERPLVSIIVPGKNEGEHLARLARSLHEQTYDNLEIIVVDDGSNDDTPVIGRALERRGIIDRFVRNEIRGGKASAANLAWNMARGNYIVHLDADCSFDRDAIENILVPFFMDANIGAVAGDVKVRNAGDGVAPGLQALEYLKSISIGRRVTSMLGILRTISGAFGAFRRDVLTQVGGWDVGPGLDGDITVKARKARFRVVFAADARCFTSVPATFSALARQRTRWSRSIVRFRMRKHRDVFLPNANFQWLNMLSFVENIMFNIVLDIKWLVYIGDILINFPTLAKYIIPANFLLYLFSNLVQYFMILAVSERPRQEAGLILYVPLMPFYMGVYMRVVRTWAYIMEWLFHTSYKDPWNPGKVSRKAREAGM